MSVNTAFLTPTATSRQRRSCSGRLALLILLTGLCCSAMAGAQIVAEDQYSFRFSPMEPNVNEGAGQVTVMVTLQGCTGPINDISWDVQIGSSFGLDDGTAATPGDDFGAPSVTQLTFGASGLTRSVSIPIFQDGTIEFDEEFSLGLRQQSLASRPSLQCEEGLLNPPSMNPTTTVTILDDDTLSSGSVSVPNVAIKETDSGLTAAIFIVTFNDSFAPGQEFIVDFGTFNDSATTADQDYVQTFGELMVSRDNRVHEIEVPVRGDTKVEPDERFFLRLRLNSTLIAQAEGVIENDDVLIAVEPVFSIDDVTVNEGDGGTTSATFMVSIPEPSSQTLRVDYATADGSALVDDADYQLTSGQLIFEPGQVSQPITVLVNGDAKAEPDERFFVNLSNPMGGAAIGDGQGQGMIRNDDPEPTVSITGAEVVEGDADTVNAVFAVTLSNPTAREVVVDYMTQDGTASSASDYQATSGQLTFSPGQTSRNLTVLVNGDVEVEADETFSVVIDSQDSLAAPQAEGVIRNDDAAALPALSIDDAQAFENTAGERITFQVRLSAPSTDVVTVVAETSNGTAIAADGDYEPRTQDITFNPGQTTRPFHVGVIDDDLVEPDETFFVDLKGPTGASLDDERAQGTIRNDDVGALPILSITGTDITEGDSGSQTGVVTLTLSAASTQTVTVEYETDDGTATAPKDFTFGAGVVTFAPGETMQMVAVQVNGDTEVEPDENFFVRLKGASNAGIDADNARAEVTIVNDDVALPEASIDNIRVLEGDAGRVEALFTVTLSAPAEATVRIGYTTQDGTATSEDNDYQPDSGVLTFAPGDTTATVSVAVLGDTRDEENEIFGVRLMSAMGATLTTDGGRCTIFNDDGAGPPVATIDNVLVTEGDSGSTEAVFTIALSSAPPDDSAQITISYATADGSATAADTDYRPTEGTVTFGAGQAFATLTVLVRGDTMTESDESFFVELTNATGATIDGGRGEGTILNDDVADLPTLTINDVTVVEGDAESTAAVFSVTLSEASTDTVTVRYSTLDDTATAADSDYVAAEGALTFAPGQRTQTITVEVRGDTQEEPHERFLVRLQDAAGAVIADNEGVGNIQNDDGSGGGLPRLSIDDVEVVEGDGGTVNAIFTATLSAVSTAPVSVRYATANGTAFGAEDYQPNAAALSFAPGETSQTLVVQVIGDRVDEPDERFFVDLSSPTGADIEKGRGIGTIRDDDEPGVGQPVSLTIGDLSVVEGAGGVVAAVFTVRASPVPTSVVSVRYATRDGSATAGSDYQAANGILRFQPGQATRTLTVQVQGDTDIEPDEDFLVVLSGVQGATIGDAMGVGLIVNDDVAQGVIRLLPIPAAVEGAGAVEVRVERSGPAARPAGVTINASAGTATAGRDFTAIQRTVRWAAGEVGTRSIRVVVRDDVRREEDETVIIRLAAPRGATLGAPQVLELVILDDDTPMRLDAVGEPARTADVEQTLELAVTASRDDEMPVEAATVRWAVTDGEAQLEGGTDALTDSNGTAVKEVALGTMPGQVTVTATLLGTEETVTFTITAEGDLGGMIDPEESPDEAEVADVIDETCADGSLDDLCDYIFDDLEDEEEQMQVIEEIVPDEVAAQAGISLEAPQVQLRNVGARLAALRGGATRRLVEQIAFTVHGDEGFDVAAIRDAAQRHGAQVDDRLLASLERAMAGEARGGAASGDEEAVAAEETASRWGGFVNGRVSIGDRPTTTREAGVDFETRGITAGLDVRLSDRFVLGAAVGYMDIETEVNGDGGRLDADGYTFSAYGTYYRKSFYLDGVASYGQISYDLVRNIDLPRPFRDRTRFVARGTPDGSQLSLSLGTGYDAYFGAFTVGGIGRLSYVDADIDGYRERGAEEFNLSIEDQQVESLLTEVGIELSYAASLGWGVLRPTVRLSYLHEFEDDGRLIRGRFANDLSNNEFAIQSDDPDRNFFNVGAGLTLVFARGWSAYVLYDTDLERDDLDIYTLTGGVRIQF